MGPQPYPVIYVVANLVRGLLDRKISEETSSNQSMKIKTKGKIKQERNNNTKHRPEIYRRVLDRESLVYRQPRGIRNPPSDCNYLAFAPKGIASTNQYSQGFRFLCRHSRRRVGSP